MLGEPCLFDAAPHILSIVTESLDRKDPNVASPGMQLDLGFVDMEYRTGDDLRQQLPICVAVVPREQIPEDEKLRPADLNPEGFVEDRRKAFCPKSMRNLLVCVPTHEAMKVPRQAMIAIRDKAALAPRTSICNSPELDHLALDCSRRDDDIKGSLSPRLDAFRASFRLNSNEILTLAEWAFRCGFRSRMHSACEQGRRR